MPSTCCAGRQISTIITIKSRIHKQSLEMRCQVRASPYQYPSITPLNRTTYTMTEILADFDTVT